VSEPHDIPSMEELVRAVREFLEHDVMDATEGRVRFHARVAANVLGMVERELVVGAAHARTHAAALARLGVSDEAELAAAIRNGTLADRRAEVLDAIRATVRAKLAVAHPGYTDPT
jgi:uncharacterized protein DUF6285